MGKKHPSVIGNVATAFVLSLSLPATALEDPHFLGNLARTDGDPMGESAWTSPSAARIAADDPGISFDVFYEWGLANRVDE